MKWRLHRFDLLVRALARVGAKSIVGTRLRSLGDRGYRVRGGVSGMNIETIAKGEVFV